MRTGRIPKPVKPQAPSNTPKIFVLKGEYDGTVVSTRGHFYIFVDFGAGTKGLLKGSSGLFVGDRVKVKITDMYYDKVLKAMSYNLKLIEVLSRITDKAKEGGEK